jgi:hypothetical protein
MYTDSQWQTLAERFNSKSFLGKIMLIKQNPDLMYIETDGYNVELRMTCEKAMMAGKDELFEFPTSFEYEHLRDIFSLADIKIKKLR